MRANDRLWMVRALFGRCGSLDSPTGSGRYTVRMHRAVMHAIPSATRWHIRRVIRSQRKQRRHEWQDNNGQQQDGQQSAQWLD